jgi:septal ring-binding cell division protein DamX
LSLPTVSASWVYKHRRECERMGKDTPPKKPKERHGKTYHIEFSLSSLVFWSVSLFVLLGWMFFLGILVGRGFLAEGVQTLSELKTQIAKVEKMVAARKPTPSELPGEMEKEPILEFHEELTSKKRDVQEAPPHTIKEKPKQEAPDGQAQRWETGGAYTVQVASLENEIKAVNMVDQLINKGYPAYFYKVHIKNRTFYRIRCGRFRDQGEADDFRGLLAQREKIKGIVARFEK